MLYSLTIAYNKIYNVEKPYGKLLLEIWRCRTLSNFGIFLLLPSLIWGSRRMLENSLTFVILFTTLSELLAYRGKSCYYILLYFLFILILY